MDKKQEIQEGGIDGIELIRKLWGERFFIFKCIGIGIIVGLLVAFSIPKQYTTNVIFTPETSSIKSSGVGALAAFAGINLNQTEGDALTALLYPDIIESTPFIKGLLDIRVTDRKRDIGTTLYTYMEEYQRAPWWSYVIKFPFLLLDLFRSSEDISKGEQNSRQISKDEMKVIEDLRKTFAIWADKTTGEVTLRVTMQSPEISAFVADTMISYLQSYIITYRTNKARQDLIHTKKLFEEAKESYHNVQGELAVFVDQNTRVVSALYRTKQEHLQNEANLAYGLYTQMAQQVQMAEIKVQDTTPVFTIIQPAVEPLKASSPSKKIILVGFVFLAVAVAGIKILWRDLFPSLVKLSKKN